MTYFFFFGPRPGIQQSAVLEGLEPGLRKKSADLPIEQRVQFGVFSDKNRKLQAR
jgi:hypothetical protein